MAAIFFRRSLDTLDAEAVQRLVPLGHQVVVHTEKNGLYMRDTLRNMESMLGTHGFFRCNNCYLVNLAYVEQVNYNHMKLAGRMLTISRPRYKPFMEALVKYVGGARA